MTLLNKEVIKMAMINLFILRLVRSLKGKHYVLEACILFLPMILLLASVTLLLEESWRCYSKAFGVK